MVLVFSAKDLQNTLYEVRVTAVYVVLDCKTTSKKILYPLNTTGLTVTDFSNAGGVSPHIRLDTIPPENQEVLMDLIPSVGIVQVKKLVVPKGTFDQILKVCVGGF